VAAHSTTRALYASYNRPLYQVMRLSDNAVKDIGVVQPVALPFPDPGGYADAAAQDAFCANTTCVITKIYDQSAVMATISLRRPAARSAARRWAVSTTCRSRTWRR
jgi:alpha-L-arabinofuranosidase B-like protein